MKQCLHCKKEFEPKKPTRKYCSDSCRVMYCRAHKVKGLSAEAKITNLYNNFIEAIAEFKKMPIYAAATPDVYDGQKNSDITHDEPTTFQQPKMKLKRSESYFLTSIRNGFDCAEDHIEFINEVNESDFSNSKKQELIAASRIKQY